MGIYLNPGNEAFQISISSEIYVDKTEMISFVNKRLGQEKRFLCVSRPRRFGKSMAANMLCAYYDRECDSKELFKRFSIAKEISFEQHLNQYDVIFLNIRQLIHTADKIENLVDTIEGQVLEEIKENYKEFLNDSITTLPLALTTIFTKESRLKKGFIFIVDEWDCIFREAKENVQVQKKYLDFLQDLFKDRTYVKLVYMTGILPIKKYGTHSALNIFDEFSMTAPKKLAKYVGFTEEEVKELCHTFCMNFEDMKRWYDGYHLRQGIHVYNPKSIVDAIMEEEIHSYWNNTETYEALKIYIDMNFSDLKNSVITLLGGGKCKINSRKFQNDMTSFESKDDIFTLLVHLGYLSFDEETQEVCIPNQEIEEEFKNVIEGESGWGILADMLQYSEKLLEATLRHDTNIVTSILNKVHVEQTSVLSYNDENSLSCVITLAYFSAKKDYIFIREFPTGKGFADIVLLPRKQSDKPAIVIELKWNYSVNGAIQQIKEKEYISALENYTGEILLVGINYSKKTKEHQCIIETYKKSKGK